MGIFEEESSTLQDEDYRNHLNRNWNNGNSEFDAINKRITNAGGSAQSDEVALARIDLHGEVFNTLASRLDSTQVSAESAESIAASKADKSDLEDKFSAIMSGAPRDTLASADAMLSRYPKGVDSNGNGLVIFNSTDGCVYYWNGSAWAKGPLYQTSLSSITDLADDKTYSISKSLSSANLNTDFSEFPCHIGKGQRISIKITDNNGVLNSTDPIHIGGRKSPDGGSLDDIFGPITTNQSFELYSNGCVDAIRFYQASNPLKAGSISIEVTVFSMAQMEITDDLGSLFAGKFNCNVSVNSGNSTISSVSLDIKAGDNVKIKLSSSTLLSNYPHGIMVGAVNASGVETDNLLEITSYDNFESFTATQDFSKIKIFFPAYIVASSGTIEYDVDVERASLQQGDYTKFLYSSAVSGSNAAPTFSVSLKRGTSIKIRIIDIDGTQPTGTQIHLGFSNGDTKYDDAALLNINEERVLNVNVDVDTIRLYSSSASTNNGLIAVAISTISQNEVSEKFLDLIKRKTVGIIGDSYSTFKDWIPASNENYFDGTNNGITNVSLTWWYQLLASLGVTLLKNESYSGSTICNTGYNGQGATTSSFLTRSSDSFGSQNILNPKPEMFWIMGGLNDTWASSPVGQVEYSGWTDSDLKEVLPAFCKMLHDLIFYNPGAKIVMIIPSDVSSEIKSGMETACKNYDVTCIPLDDNYDKNNGHPTDIGMAHIANQVLFNL